MASVLSESLLTKLTSIIGSITTQTAQSGTVPASKQLLLKEVRHFKIVIRVRLNQILDQRVQGYAVSRKTLRTVFRGRTSHHRRTRRHHLDA